MPTWKEIQEAERERVHAEINKYFAPARLHLSWLTGGDVPTEDYSLTDEDGDGVDISCFCDDNGTLLSPPLRRGDIVRTHDTRVPNLDNKIGIVNSLFRSGYIGVLMEHTDPALKGIWSQSGFPISDLERVERDEIADSKGLR